MNILVIGNGFDLAHKLPTKYTDFLERIASEIKLWEKLKKDGREVANRIKMLPLDVQFPKNKKVKVEIDGSIDNQVELWNCINKNIWVDYFLNNPMYQRENWIDFEKEISKVIQSLDVDMNSQIKCQYSEDKIARISDDFLNHKYLDWFANRTYRELRDVLLHDLDRLIRVLEIYLAEYVEKIDMKKKSPDIEGLEIDFVLSFNYTHTFSKLYNISERAKQEKVCSFDYIHGETNKKNTIETNNMVLGIDEYLPKKKRNKETEFIAFKKYYQRIYKQTGNEHKRWVEIIKNQIQVIDDKVKEQYPVQIPYNKLPNRCRNQLYIFGHSLDITDKDILRDLILNDNVYTTIYYPNREELGKKIANLVKVIGQDELIRRTGGSTKTIEFKQQQDMIPIEE